MEYRRLGRTGLKVSVLSFGSMNFGRQSNLEQAKELLSCLKEQGVNFYDNAEIYAKGESDKIFGQAVKDLGWKRSDIVVSAKIMFGTGDAKLNARGLSRKHVVEGLRGELERLQMEYVDLVFCHRPDPETGMEEIVRGMNHVIEKGWAFYWGTSEWSAQQITQAWGVADKLKMIGPAMDQCQYNLIERNKVEKEFLPLYELYGTGLTTWSPLFSGFLTGKYVDGLQQGGKDSRLNSAAWNDFGGMMKMLREDKRLEGVPKLKPIAERLGCSMAQLALAWCVANKNVSTVILGATKKEQILDNCKCLEVVPKLTPEVMAELDTALGTKP